jgi:hypothetical protein
MKYYKVIKYSFAAADWQQILNNEYIKSDHSKSIQKYQTATPWMNFLFFTEFYTFIVAFSKPHPNKNCSA